VSALRFQHARLDIISFPNDALDEEVEALRHSPSEPQPVPFDVIASFYDALMANRSADVEFYVQEAVRAGTPVVELGVGTGRIAIPTARAGIHVIGVDASLAMLEICRRRASEEGVSDRLTLAVGDFRDPGLEHVQARLVTVLSALRAARGLLARGGRFIFDVFAPSAATLSAGDIGWVEWEPGIWHRTKWDAATRTARVSLRTNTLHEDLCSSWLSRDEWRTLLARAGLVPEAVHDAFDRRPYPGSQDSIWVAVPADNH
jgi:SAM-dependent methyltransferase